MLVMQALPQEVANLACVPLIQLKNEHPLNKDKGKLFRMSK
jgi:hypothetical protein